MRFDWDNNKNKSNLDKHGLSFEEAVTVFESGAKLYKSVIINGEIRQLYLGLSGGFVVVLVVVTRRRAVIRVISARIANKKEKLFYYDD